VTFDEGDEGVTDVAVVTGGAGGIGQAINRRLVREGYTVVAGDLAAAIEADDPGTADGSVVAVEMDVRDQASVDAAMATAAGLGRLRSVVNCAGLVRFTPVDTAEEDAMEILWAVNVAGMARVNKAAARHLVEGSAIVNIASLTGLIGRLTGASMYGASKAGVMAYTRYLACELADRGVRVNCLAPGYIAVPMSDSMRAVSGGEDALIPTVPLKRLGTVDEMADIVEFLLSDRAAYITGATLVADGGVTAL
jgi:3-oxoacyl-[acyl-carrier protein] reductase